MTGPTVFPILRRPSTHPWTVYRRWLFVPLGLLLIASLSTACTLFGTNDQSVVATAVPRNSGHSTAVTIKNNREEPIWTFAVGQNIAARLLWRPTLDEGHIPPGGTRTVSMEEIALSDRGEDTILVYWWGAVNDNGTLVPGNITSLRVAR